MSQTSFCIALRSVVTDEGKATLMSCHRDSLLNMVMRLERSVKRTGMPSVQALTLSLSKTKAEPSPLVRSEEQTEEKLQR